MLGLVFALLGAALQVPILAASISDMRTTDELLRDPGFVANVIDGGTADDSGADEESPWARVARIRRPALWEIICSGVGIILAIAAAWASATDR